MIDDKVRAVLLAGIILMALLTGGQYWLEHRVVEPFSELSVLGPDRTMGGYPSSVAVGQNTTLYAYVGNHEGRVTYYDVKVKLGNSTTVVNETTWAYAPTLEEFRVILTDGQNATFLVQLAFSQPANGTKLVFELWEMNPTLNEFQYSGLWGQILMNVTAS